MGKCTPRMLWHWFCLTCVHLMASSHPHATLLWHSLQVPALQATWKSSSALPWEMRCQDRISLALDHRDVYYTEIYHYCDQIINRFGAYSTIHPCNLHNIKLNGGIVMLTSACLAQNMTIYSQENLSCCSSSTWALLSAGINVPLSLTKSSVVLDWALVSL